MLQKTDGNIFLSDDPKMEFKHELASYQFYLTEIEKNIVMALYAEIDNTQTLQSTIFRKRISFSELAKICNLTSKDYNKIKRAVWSLFRDRYVSLIGADALNGWHWLINVEINQKEKYFVFDWNPIIVELFLFDSHEGSFISAKRDTLIGIKGNYGYRFYFWFCQWIANKNEVTLKIRDIADMLDLPKSYYTDKYPTGVDGGQIASKIIRPALAKLINTDIDATAEYLKTGRYIDSVKFKFWWRKSKNPLVTTTDTIAKPVIAKPVEKTPKKAEPKQQLTDEQQSMYDELVERGLNKKYAKKFVIEKPLEEIRISVDCAQKRKDAGKVDDWGAFLRAAIADGYGVAEARSIAREQAAAEAQAKDKIDNMTPEQKAAYMSRQELLKQSAALAAEAEAPAAPVGEVNTEEQNSKVKELMKRLEAEHLRAKAEKGKRKKIN